MEQFKVIEGKQSDKYNHFRDFEYINCIATDTRLMGVVAMRVLWKDPEDYHHQYEQIIHLDFSEYGIDDYFEYEIMPESDQHEADSQEALKAWINISKDLGGKVVHLDPATWLKLIEDAMDVARNNIMQRYDEFAVFRETTFMRIGLMKEALIEQDLLGPAVDSQSAIARVVPKKLTTYETINYFLMRLVDRDFEAAAYLSTMSVDELMKQPLAANGICSLIKNSIGESETCGGIGYLYGTESISSGENGYYVATSMLTLDGEPDDENRRIKSIRTGFSKKLSTYESAIAISSPEYITVYDIPDEVLFNLEINRIEMFELASPKMVDNGWLLPIYRRDNTHVDKALYHIGGDIIGNGLVSIPGEFILMSTRLMDSNALENSVAESVYGDKFVLKGRYHIKESVFQTICSTTGSMFEDFVMREDGE